jgi:hypothetical protein
MSTLTDQREAAAKAAKEKAAKAKKTTTKES